MYLNELFLKTNFHQDALLNEIINSGVGYADLSEYLVNKFGNHNSYSIKYLVNKLNVPDSKIRYRIKKFDEYIKTHRIGAIDIRLDSYAVVKVYLINYYLENVGTMKNLEKIIEGITNNGLIYNKVDEEYIGFNDLQTEENCDKENLVEVDKLDDLGFEIFEEDYKNQMKVQVLTSKAIFENVLNLSERRDELKQELEDLESEIELTKIKYFEQVEREKELIKNI